MLTREKLVVFKEEMFLLKKNKKKSSLICDDIYRGIFFSRTLIHVFVHTSAPAEKVGL